MSDNQPKDWNEGRGLAQSHIANNQGHDNNSNLWNEQARNAY
jgi:hypothetical protein